MRQESPEWVEMIEENDDILSLSDAERLLICASILETPYYKSQNLEVDKKWMESTQRADIFRRPIEFLNEYNNLDKLSLICILCKALNRRNKKVSYDILYTRSYNDENSVFVLRIKNSYLEFDSYAKNIPILMNAKRNLKGFIQQATHTL